MILDTLAHPSSSLIPPSQASSPEAVGSLRQRSSGILRGATPTHHRSSAVYYLPKGAIKEGPAERRETPGMLHILQPHTFAPILADGDDNDVFSSPPLVLWKTPNQHHCNVGFNGTCGNKSCQCPTLVI